MASVSQRRIAPLSVVAFRKWAESRPNEEHWELVDGVPIMRTPPTHDHQRIASDLERLLNDAIERLPQPHSPPVAAYQRIGVNLGPVVEDYDPEPDVAVVEIATSKDRRYADRFFLVAEVVSPSDEPTIEGKREMYKRPPRLRMRSHHPARPLWRHGRSANRGGLGAGNSVGSARAIDLAGVWPAVLAQGYLQRCCGSARGRSARLAGAGCTP